MNCGKNGAGVGMAIVLGLMAVMNPALAQEPVSAARAGSSDAYPAYRLNFLQRATDLTGAEVRDRQGHKLGKIADLVVDCTSWRVICALVKPANFYGATEYYIAVPAKSFFSAGTNRAVVDVNMTNLLGLPRFKSDGWDAAAIYSSLTNAYARFNQPLPWNEQTGLGRLALCGNLLDMEVNTGNVNVGRVADLMMDLAGERVMFAVIAFYGSDENLHLVPPGAMTLDANETSYQLKIESAQVGELVNRQEFLWRDLADPERASANYRAYGRELAFDASAAGTLESSRKLVRDYVPPPVVVTNAEVENPDAEMTRKVWKAILEADLDNGFLAKEMKISTVNGKVTLTGRVGQEKERGGFGTIAEGVAGAENVKNELEVKLAK
jgi:sporulation protein YlmC with PRC-barrel domain